MVYDPMEQDDLQELVHLFEDSESGVKGAIIIHSTALGPAAGGCRFWSYPDDAAMVADGIRLAQGMSYKNALAGIPFGGGKAVLQVPARPFDRDLLFRAFGRAVDDLKGRYVTAEDVGTSVADMREVARNTRHVAGLSPMRGRAGGDPSPWTALGIFNAMRAAARVTLGAELRDLRVGVQGVGNVGQALCSLLADAGATLVVADIDAARSRAAVERYGAELAGNDAILESDIDIFAPCALGGVLTGDRVERLRARMICGGANNQLADGEVGEALRQLGIIYAPDYVVNAGGIISVAAEYLGESVGVVRQCIAQIGDRLISIIVSAERENRATNLVADAMARETILKTRSMVA